MKGNIDVLLDNSLFISVVSAVITFFLGRYTSYLDDYRQGRKDVNEKFYKPFMSLYTNEHHSYALYFVDLSLETQRQIVTILNDNINIVPSRIRTKIMDLDQCYSGYRNALDDGLDLLDDEKIFVEQIFSTIYSYIEKQYVKNERKLYCTLSKRIYFRISELTDKVIAVIRKKKHK